MTVRLSFFHCLIPALALMAMAGTLTASEEGEFYVNTMRDLGKISPIGTRSAAMGGSGRGLADGVASLGVNPAALGAFQGTGFETGIGLDWLDDGDDNANQMSFRIGGAANLDKWSNTCSRNQAIGGLLETKGYSSAAGVGMKRNQTGVLFGYGVHLMDDLLAGVSVALYSGKWSSDVPGPSEYLMDRKFNGGDFKVGGIYRLQDETTLGGTIGYTTGSYKEKAPGSTSSGSGSVKRFSIGSGIAHQYSQETLVLGDIWYEKVDTDLPGLIDETNKNWGISVGVEQQVIPEMLALRGGLYYDRNSYSSSGTAQFVENGSFSKGRFGVTAGAGLKLYNFDVGYSLDVNSGGSVKNTLDISTEW